LRQFILIDLVIQPIPSNKNLETAIVAASKELDSTAFKQDFISTTSHEMRTPLNGIVGEVDNLETLVQHEYHRGSLSKDVFDAIIDSLSIISGSAQIQLMIVDNMLSTCASIHKSIYFFRMAKAGFGNSEAKV
jgi:signal transduction histidine kinase